MIEHYLVEDLLNGINYLTKEIDEYSERLEDVIIERSEMSHAKWVKLGNHLLGEPEIEKEHRICVEEVESCENLMEEYYSQLISFPRKTVKEVLAKLSVEDFNKYWKEVSFEHEKRREEI